MYNMLRPFPATTGIALTALAGDPELGDDSRVATSLDYLKRELTQVRAPLSLAWGLIGLTAWSARPEQAPQWLAEAAQQCLQREPHPLYDELLLIADADPCPLITEVGAATSDEGR
jgi:hypothetical protein